MLQGLLLPPPDVLCEFDLVATDDAGQNASGSVTVTVESVEITKLVTDQSGNAKQTFTSDLTSAKLIEVKTLDGKVMLTGTPNC